MKDGWNREIDYLRISLTDRCNLRCRYCMPEEGVPALPHSEIVSYDEITRLVHIFAGLGVRRLRLTGGEPLVRRDVPALAAMLRAVPGIEYIGLTTNGILLPQQAGDLYAAGVQGVNLSIDTLDRARYAALTRRDLLPQALAGLDAALATGFAPVKVNCVLAPESIEADWLAVVALAKKLPVDVRLIEWMPLSGEAPQPATRAPAAKARIEAEYGPLQTQPDTQGGPAELFAVPGFRGRVGFIHAMSHNFCGSCNRVRLTATGALKLCLFYDVGTSLRALLRSGADDEEIRQAICAALQHKPRRHNGVQQTQNPEDPAERLPAAPGMNRIGG